MIKKNRVGQGFGLYGKKGTYKLGKNYLYAELKYQF